MDEHLDGKWLGQHLAIFVDASNALGFEQVRALGAAEFQTSTQTAPGFGFTDSTYWVRLQVQNGADERTPWLLELAYPHLDEVELFVPTEGDGYATRLTGDHVPFSQRDLEARNFVFRLEEPAGGTRTYFLRVHTSGSLNLPLRGWTVATFLGHYDHEQTVISMFYGLMLVMAAYNAFIFFFVRLREYLYYSLYIVSLLLFQGTLNGHTFQYLLRDQIWLANHVLPFSISFSLVWTSLFMTTYLGLKESFPHYDRLWRTAARVLAALAAFGLLGPYNWSIRVTVVTGALTTMSLPLTSIVLTRRGVRQAKLYLIAWSMLILGVLLYFAKSVGLLPMHFITTWGIQIGASLEVVLLSLALADRINTMRTDLSHLNGQLSANVARLEEALKRAEEATVAKSDFLATVSHELRTPLNAIINLPQALLDDVPEVDAASCARCESVFALDAGEEVGPETPCPECEAAGGLRVERQPHFVGSPEQLRKHLGHIERSGRHLLQMVNGILDLSKMEAGKFELSLAPVTLSALLHDAVDPLTQLATSKGVRLDIQEVKRDGTLQADALRLTQVLINLIGNAIKFSNGRGSVRVGARLEGGFCTFRVADEGIGIAPEDAERIFGSFEQVDRGDTRKYGGTGLGLSISKALVELHGGTIWVESALGQGSTFYFKVPTAGPRGPANDLETACPGPREPENPSSIPVPA